MHETSAAHLHFDFPPTSGRVAAGTHTLRGWLVAKPGWHFTDLRAVVSGTTFPAIYGYPRRDLAQHFGSAAPVLLAGFELQVRLSAGRQSLVLEACDVTGVWLKVDTLELEVTPGTDSATAPVRPTLLSHEFSLALRVLLRRLAEGKASLAALAAEIATATPLQRTLRFAHQPFHGHVDQPAAWDRVVFGRLPVSGWLFHESEPVRRVLATTDLQACQELPAGRGVPAIAARFKDFPHAQNCGFEGVIDLPAQLPSPACIRLYAELGDGSWHLGPVVRAPVTDHEFEKQPYVRYSAWTFWRARQALHRAFVHAGFDLPGKVEWRPAHFANFHAFRLRAPRRDGAPAPVAPPPAHPTGPVVLFTHNLNREGAPLFLLEFARHLAQEQQRSLIVISAREGPLRPEFEALRAQVRIVDTSAVLRAPTTGALRVALEKLSAQIDLSGAALVVANTLSCFWAVHLAHRAGRRSLFYIHESTPPASFYLGHLAPAALPVVEETFRLATRVSFLTPATQHYFTALSTGTNYCINPGWVDLAAIDRFRAAHSRAALRARLGLPAAAKIVVNVGTVCDRKGQHIFARAVDLLWRHDPATAATAQFLMIGGRETPYDQALAAFLPDLCRPNLRIVPETPDVFAWYGAADLFVCSSYEESFPRVVLEAMAFELPIVATQVQGIPEITRPDLEALLVPPGDSAALAAAMLRLLRAPETGATLAARARARVESEFDMSVVQLQHAALTDLLVTVEL